MEKTFVTSKSSKKLSLTWKAKKSILQLMIWRLAEYLTMEVLNMYINIRKITLIIYEYYLMIKMNLS